MTVELFLFTNPWQDMMFINNHEIPINEISLMFFPIFYLANKVELAVIIDNVDKDSFPLHNKPLNLTPCKSGHSVFINRYNWNKTYVIFSQQFPGMNHQNIKNRLPSTFSLNALFMFIYIQLEISDLISPFLHSLPYS